MDIRHPRSTSGMLIVELPNRRIGIAFRHLFTNAMVRGKDIKTRLTYCGIYDISGGEDQIAKIGYGVAKCSELDNFSKEKGRKVSLTRALLGGDHFLSGNTPETKLLREIIWNTYRNRSRVNTPKAEPFIEGQVVDEKKLLEAPVGLVN